MNKKEELLINAAMIIYEEGIQQLTIDYLAKRTSLSKGGVLYHFDSKDNLLLEMNKMAVEKFEQLLERYERSLSGVARYTRAYALSTLAFFKESHSIFLPAVFISSLEHEQSKQLWESTLASWEQEFREDDGDLTKKLQLRLICDGIWFHILYGKGTNIKKEIKELVLSLCNELEKE